MSAQSQFRAKLESDPEFVKKVKASADAAGIVKVAKAHGIELGHADVAQALVKSDNNLSDEELESVSSGTPLAAALIK